MNVRRKQYISCIIVLLAVYLVLAGFLLYFEKQTDYDRLTNRLYYDNILLVRNEAAIDWDSIGDSQQYRVSVELDPSCRALLKDTSTWTPPLLSGCYPGEGMGAAAVIGKNVKGMLHSDEGGDPWISFMGQEFRVTGVVGAEYATSCDDLILLFGAQFPERELSDLTYVVDVETKRGARQIAGTLIHNYPEVRIQQGAIKGTARLTKSSYFYRLLITELLFTTVFTIYIFSIFRHKNYDTHYKVYQLCGLPFLALLLRGELEVLFINFASLLAASGIWYVRGRLAGGQFRKLTGIAAGITVLSCFLELVFFAQSIRKASDSDRIHGKRRERSEKEGV